MKKSIAASPARGPLWPKPVDDVWITAWTASGPTPRRSETPGRGTSSTTSAPSHSLRYASTASLFEVERDTALRAVDCCGEGRELAAFDEWQGRVSSPSGDSTLIPAPRCSAATRTGAARTIPSSTTLPSSGFAYHGSGLVAADEFPPPEAVEFRRASPRCRCMRQSEQAMALQLTQDQESIRETEKVCLEFEDDFGLNMTRAASFRRSSIAPWRMVAGSVRPAGGIRRSRPRCYRGHHHDAYRCKDAGGMSAASAIHMNIFGPHPISVFGSEEQKRVGYRPDRWQQVLFRCYRAQLWSQYREFADTC